MFSDVPYIIILAILALCFFLSVITSFVVGHILHENQKNYPRLLEPRDGDVRCPECGFDFGKLFCEDDDTEDIIFECPCCKTLYYINN